jgi:hypothetical protein
MVFGTQAIFQNVWQILDMINPVAEIFMLVYNTHYQMYIKQLFCELMNLQGKEISFFPTGENGYENKEALQFQTSKTYFSEA